MSTSPKEAEIIQAVDCLSQSDVGKEALEVLRKWFREGRGLSLDSQNIEAVNLLLSASWGSMPGTVLEAIER